MSLLNSRLNRDCLSSDVDTGPRFLTTTYCTIPSCFYGSGGKTAPREFPQAHHVRLRRLEPTQKDRHAAIYNADQAKVFKLAREDLGRTVLGRAPDCPSALGLIWREKPDLALVDTHLGSGTCEVVLEQCDQQAVQLSSPWKRKLIFPISAAIATGWPGTRRGNAAKDVRIAAAIQRVRAVIYCRVLPKMQVH